MADGITREPEGTPCLTHLVLSPDDMGSGRTHHI
jgi:hypothetical protein